MKFCMVGDKVKAADPDSTLSGVYTVEAIKVSYGHILIALEGVHIHNPGDMWYGINLLKLADEEVQNA